jgi:hypothetical protein
MICTGTPSGSSTDDRAEGLLAELEGGPNGNHRGAALLRETVICGG